MKIRDEKIRINVDTFNGLKEWKNIKDTGYIRFDSIINPFKSIITYVDRIQGPMNIMKIFLIMDYHSIHAGIYPDGSTSWKKEIWFIGGYTK